MCNLNENKSGVFRYFSESARKYPEECALEIGNQKYSYSTLGGFAQQIGNSIRNSLQEKPDELLTGILAYRSLTVYAGILGALAAGGGYVPVSPKFPAERIGHIFNTVHCPVLIVGKEFYKMLPDICYFLNYEPLWIFPFDTPPETIKNKQHIFLNLTIENSIFQDHYISWDVSLDKIAYLLFTSGSTGTPKGIPISHGNLTSFIDYIKKRCPLNTTDRCSQAFDTTFDVSVHDLMITWASGACLCSMPVTDLIAPANFISKKKLTVWYSVPSIPTFMLKMHTLKPNAFPSLRYSFFAGEALGASIVEAFAKAAPNSRIINAYGPTELTITITDYEWRRNIDSCDTCRNGFVPIGKTYSTHEDLIVDPTSLLPVKDGECGELLIHGPQQSKGYFENPIKTAEAFVECPCAPGKIFYRTGDLVVRNSEGNLDYLGRIDFQVKVRGYRVEIQEIENTLKKLTKHEECIVFGYPPNTASVDYLLAAIAGEEMDKTNILNGCASILPDYMVPKDIVFLHNFPLNNNGKVDRKAIIDYYLKTTTVRLR